jgi:hypothetical protein
MLFPELASLMSEPYIQILLIYGVFMGVGTLLALVRRWVKPNRGVDSVWKKYPTYFVLNMTFLAAIWLPQLARSGFPFSDHWGRSKLGAQPGIRPHSTRAGRVTNRFGWLDPGRGMAASGGLDEDLAGSDFRGSNC